MEIMFDLSRSRDDRLKPPHQQWKNRSATRKSPARCKIASMPSKWQPVNRKQRKEPRRIGSPPLPFKEYIAKYPKECFVCFLNVLNRINLFWG